MRSITRLFTAFATLADSLLSLSAVVDEATAHLRQQVGLHHEPMQLERATPPEAPPAPGTPEAEPAVNGTAKRGRKAS